MVVSVVSNQKARLQCDMVRTGHLCSTLSRVTYSEGLYPETLSMSVCLLKRKQEGETRRVTFRKTELFSMAGKKIDIWLMPAIDMWFFFWFMCLFRPGVTVGYQSVCGCPGAAGAGSDCVLSAEEGKKPGRISGAGLHSAIGTFMLCSGDPGLAGLLGHVSTIVL